MEICSSGRMKFIECGKSGRKEGRDVMEWREWVVGFVMRNLD